MVCNKIDIEYIIICFYLSLKNDIFRAFFLFNNNFIADRHILIFGYDYFKNKLLDYFEIDQYFLSSLNF